MKSWHNLWVRVFAELFLIHQIVILAIFQIITFFIEPCLLRNCFFANVMDNTSAYMKFRIDFLLYYFLQVCATNGFDTIAAPLDLTLSVKIIAFINN